MKKKKQLLTSVVLLASLMLTAACGSNTNSDKQSATVTNAPSSSATASPTASPSEPVTISLYAWSNITDAATAGNWVGLKAEFEQKNPNIKIEFKTLAGTDEEIMKKLDVSLVAGDTTDIIVLKNPTFTAKYSAAGFLMPLDELAAKQSYDLVKTYGRFLKKTNDKVMSLPNGFSSNILYYNKKIFDDAGVPYPTNGMTWEQYVDLAKKVTNPDKGIYGSYMQPWPHYLYWLASQKHVSAYKQDGTSNLDDPAFKESFKFINDLSAVYKVQPSKGEMIAKKYDWDAFTTGKFAMNLVGSWQVGTMADTKTYPRDWKYGIVAGPAPADGKNMLVAVTSIGINAHSKHPDEALKAIAFFAENAYKAGSGQLPALDYFTPEQYKEALKLLADQSKGEVTVDELYKAIFDNGLGTADEQITGVASAQIQDAMTKESEKYFFNKQTLEDTMTAIKKQSDQFIEKQKQ